MATETTNYKLKKPAPDDFYNIEDFNANFDAIDKALSDIAKDPTQGQALEEVKKEIEVLKSGKANKPKTLNITIPHTAWTGSSAPYKVTITVDALTGAETELCRGICPLRGDHAAKNSVG